jgi:hypothetical protein
MAEVRNNVAMHPAAFLLEDKFKKRIGAILILSDCSCRGRIEHSTEAEIFAVTLYHIGLGTVHGPRNSVVGQFPATRQTRHKATFATPAI